MKAIILVAGRGERMYPYTVDTPKCLLDIGGITILEHQLQNLRHNDINKVVLITGFRADKIEAAVAEMDLYDMDISFIYNPFYDVSNNLFSLSMAIGEMNEDFMIVNGDDVFHPGIIKNLLDAKGQEITLMVNEKDDYDSDDMKVKIVGQNIVKVNKIMKNVEADAESIGIMKFTNKGIEQMRNMVFEMANGPAGKTDWYLKAIQNIAEKYNTVGFALVNGLPWGEIDFPEDLEYVRSEVLREIKQDLTKAA